ncbi:hypothetical protein [Nocardia sp. NPDC050710]|uniref:hypothetical protein n=1 Tax=Nocardia sp. NPDC050710 TaxID=3157220 RepID=UPI0033CE927E
MNQLLRRYRERLWIAPNSVGGPAENGCATPRPAERIADRRTPGTDRRWAVLGRATPDLLDYPPTRGHEGT